VTTRPPEERDPADWRAVADISPAALLAWLRGVAVRCGILAVLWLALKGAGCTFGFWTP
jgi:hypothetical protein